MSNKERFNEVMENIKKSSIMVVKKNWSADYFFTGRLFGEQREDNTHVGSDMCIPVMCKDGGFLAEVYERTLKFVK